MKAMQSCGVAVSSNAMLDSLDDLEVAQEGVQRSSEWELEQGRRRRRRRRNSLESMEERAALDLSASEGAATAADEEHKEQAAALSAVRSLAPVTGRRSTSGNGGVGMAPLERADSGSSLRSPSIDISTFLNLMQRRAEAPPSSLPSRPVHTGLGVLREHASDASSAGVAGPRGSVAHPSSRNPLASPAGQAPSAQAQPWERAGFQSSSAANDSARHANTNNTNPSSSSNNYTAATTSSPRFLPSLRLRDPSQHNMDVRFAALSLGPRVPVAAAGEASGVPGSVSHTPLRRGLTGHLGHYPPGLDDDDDDDFNPEMDLLAAFHTFDPTQSGTMSVPHLVAIMTHMGEKWSEDEALEMADEIDARREGRFNYRSLVHKVRSTAASSDPTAPAIALLRPHALCCSFCVWLWQSTAILCSHCILLPLLLCSLTS